MAFADGSSRQERWRLVTNLMDHGRYPVDALVRLYHERWEVVRYIRTARSRNSSEDFRGATMVDVLLMRTI
ncbi:hypothetical protein C9F11_44400 (plasmid) [Streptomyces sp. YIM 121038]|uniref:hypothetical protein n=1 Tax=Streptomyces sp. YIM 121038 TaxID=2136401 RepID=UPI001110709B|nr:hypothetical protein [Streptomyces sp. YIM 121038]QCX82452.1 hypothetical protein C9F11_44400 [Streptomyces sp. YIM 121038]